MDVKITYRLFKTNEYDDEQEFNEVKTEPNEQK